MTDPVESPTRAAPLLKDGDVVDRLKQFRLRWQEDGDLTYLGKALTDAVVEIESLRKAPASPPEEALPSQTSGAEAGVLSTLNRMVTDYLAPDTYKARFPRENIPWHSDFPMPDKHHSEAGADQVNRRRDQAFIRDVIHLQDNPTGIKPREPDTLAKPASEPAGGGVMPCPFCGSAGKMISCMGSWAPGGYEPDGRRITCEAMDCCGVGKPFYGEGMEAKAIAWWNRRSALSSPASSSPAEAEALQAGVDDLKAAWSFLQDRLLEFEQEIGSGEEEREWAGHVHPALVRFNRLIASLSSAPAQEDGSKDLNWHPRDSGQNASSVEGGA